MTVANPTPGGGVSNSVTFAVSQSIPAVTALSPAVRNAGSGAFTLTVTGTNFVSGATVCFSGAPRVTTCTSGTELIAAILAGDVATPGGATVTVTNPDQSSSEPVGFQVCAASGCPAITRLSPSAQAGGTAFTLTVTGANFVSGSTVKWNEAARMTTFVSANQLTASISAADIAAVETANVTVEQVSGRDTLTSNSIAYRICGVANGCPVLGTLGPSSVNLNSPPFTLDINGRGFASGATVRWNGVARTTPFVSSARLSRSWKVLRSQMRLANLATVSPSVREPAKNFHART